MVEVGADAEDAWAAAKSVVGTLPWPGAVRDGVAAEAATAAAVARAGGGCEARGVEVEKWVSMQDATCASRAVSLPSGPLGGRAVWQIGHSSSSRRTGIDGCGGGGGVRVAGGSGVSMSSMER